MNDALAREEGRSEGNEDQLHRVLLLALRGAERFELDCDAFRPNYGPLQKPFDHLAVAGFRIGVAVYAQGVDHKLLDLRRRDASDDPASAFRPCNSACET